MQFILMIGASDITDIITNTLGVIIGVALNNLLLKLFKSNDKIPKLSGFRGIISKKIIHLELL